MDTNKNQYFPQTTWKNTTVDDEFDEVDRLADVARIRYLVAHLLEKYGFVGKVQPKMGVPNPFYMRVNKNKRAVFALEFFDGIIPCCIYTHFGAIEFEYGENFMRYHEAAKGISENARNLFLREFKKLFEGHVKLANPSQNEDGTVKNGPVVYLIDKLPWRDEMFNEPFEIVKTAKDCAGKVDYQERKHVAEVFNEVNQEFIKRGHPDIMLTVPATTPEKTVKLSNLEKEMI